MKQSVLCLLALVAIPLSAQQLALPAWLENYPGATATAQNRAEMLESSYTIAKVQLDDVVAHYQKVFDGAKVPFQANPDGIGTTIRAAAPECDLMIQLRERSDGTSVHVYCSTPSKNPAGEVVTSPSAKQAPAPTVIRPQTTRVGAQAAPQIPADMMERHKQLAAEMGIGRQHSDAPAPPLVWPSWLTHVQGAPLKPERGTNYAKDETLTAHYLTNVPMTELRDFYRGLLESHEYRGSSGIETGHTMAGVQQNAFGHVDGSNYPDGSPGARTEIEVKFDRSVLNGPITVTLRFTTHAYIAKRGY